MTPSQMKQRLQSIDIKAMVLSILSRIDDEALLLLREQWERGENSDGNPIGYYASTSYAQMKHDMNPLAGLGVVDLMLTHALERGLFLEVSGDKYDFKSSDDKYPELRDRYPKAWDLKNENKQEFNQILIDKLRDEFYKVL